MTVAGTGGVGVPQAGGAADIWEVSDADKQSLRLTSDEVLASICQGRIGLMSQVRRPGEANWTRTASMATFAYGLPRMNLPPKKRKGKAQEIVGLVALNPHLPRALDVARKLAADPKARNLGFWLSANIDWLPAPIVRRTRLFQMWDGFWIAPIVESSSVKPGCWLNVYLVAFNLASKEQHRTLRATGGEIPGGMRGNLSFAVPPGRWAAQLVSFAGPDAPGEYKIGFKTRTGGERAATAIAVGVLTLGSFIYAPGSSGFSLRYRILPPQVAQTVVQWETYAVQAAERRFDQARATAISDGMGNRIPRESVFQRFRPYLTPSLLLTALEDKQRGPEAAVASLFDDFVFDAFGVDAAEKAFVAT